MPETFEFGDETRHGDEVHVAVRVPPASLYFDGHFEGRPMLPGVAQVVGLAHRLALRTFAPGGPPKRLVRAKFSAVVLPGDDVKVVLAREESEPGELRVRYRIERGTDVACSGVIVYGA